MVKQEWVICFSSVFVLMISQTLAATKSPMIATTKPPIIPYVCDVKGSINITTSELKSRGYSRIRVFGNSTSQSCKMSFANVSTLSTNIELTGCAWNTPVHVEVTKAKATRLRGGHESHEYTITCNIPDGGVTLNATATLNSIATPPPSPETRAPVLAVTMTIIPNTTVTIGQELKLEIRPTDQLPQSMGKLYVLPETCSARPGAVSQTGGTTPASLDLLKSQSAQTADKEIMETFTIADNGSAITTIYAFRFIESQTIILQCKVHVCMDKSCNMTFKYYASTTPSTPSTTTTPSAPTSHPPTTTPSATKASSTTKATAGRRKRGVEDKKIHNVHHQTHVVKAMFSVMEDKRKPSGQASTVLCSTWLIGLMLVESVLVLL